MECTSATKHELPGRGNKESQIGFAGDVGVWERAWTKNIFLNQEVVGVMGFKFLVHRCQQIEGPNQKMSLKESVPFSTPCMKCAPGSKQDGAIALKTEW